MEIPYPPPEVFRGFMSSYFTGVAIVTSADAEGRPHGMTCNSLTSVTLSPPTLLVCLDVRSRTLAAVRARARFVVNVIHEGGWHAAELFATRQPDRFEQVVWQGSPLIGLPWLVADAYAMAECQVTDSIIVGDHAVVFGSVMNVKCEEGSPLLYGMRSYFGGSSVMITR